MKTKLQIRIIVGVFFLVVFQLLATKVFAQNRDIFDDSRKVNEYVSWYLNGTIGRAEYPPLDPHNNADITKITSYSGPLNKRLPIAYIDLMKINTIESASQINATTNLPENHNQIVVCASKFLGLFGPASPHPCYPFPGYPAYDEYRLQQWEGDLSGLAGILNWGLGTDFWNSRKPPLPWGNDQQGNPMTALTYRRYYNEWRGNTCVLIPIIDSLVCVDNPFVSNEWADLFPYIPLANNTDKDAIHSVGTVQLRPNPGTIAYYQQPPDENPQYPASSAQLDGSNPDVVHEPVLYYPHTLETVTLSDMLNEVFSPQDRMENVDQETPDTDYENVGCEIVDTRTNPGDNLFQSSPDSRIDDLAVYVDIQIDAIGCPAGPIDTWIADCGCTWPNDCPTRHGCELTSVCTARNSDLNPDGTPFTLNDCVDPSCTDPLSCCNTYPDQCTTYPGCPGSIGIRIPTTPQIPYASQIWRSTVVGPESTFRRIFPKVEEGAPVSCIADLTGTSSTQYAALPDGTYTPLVSVETPLATNPAAGGVVSSELYFPYQGTVYEYFLWGIQTALRPKGYGHPIPDGTQCGAIQPGVGDCRMWLFMPDASGQLYYDKIIQQSASITCGGGSFNPFWAIAIALNENGGLMTDDPIGMSNSHFGCNLSVVQTIEEKMDCMFYTFQSYCLSGMTTDQMLQTYGYPAGYFHWPLSVLYGGTTNPPYPPLFGSGYNTGQLIANLLAVNWPLAYPNAPAIFCPNSPVLVPPPYN